MDKLLKKYDVVILTHAPKDEIVFSIERLLSQKIKPNSIVLYNTNENIFYDNISDADKLKKLLADNSIIKLVNIEDKDFDHGRARNNARKLCSSDYILYMTDDAVPYDDNLASDLMDAFTKYDTESMKVAVSYARQIAKESAILTEKYVREFNYPGYDIIKEKSREKELGIKNYFCSNVCAMYDASIFDSLGGFEEDLILNEDTFYVYNAINNGYSVVYKADAKVIHSHDLSFKEQFSRNFDIGVSQCERKEIFCKIPSTAEGVRFAFNIFTKLVLKLHFILAVGFLIECAHRFFGFRSGMSFERLPIEKCIEYANNKNYFIKKDRDDHRINKKS